MKAEKVITNTSELSFERFKNAVRHIISVPKSKIIEVENKNGTSHQGRNGRNGKSQHK